MGKVGWIGDAKVRNLDLIDRAPGLRRTGRAGAAVFPETVMGASLSRRALGPGDKTGRA